MKVKTLMQPRRLQAMAMTSGLTASQFEALAFEPFPGGSLVSVIAASKDGDLARSFLSRLVARGLGSYCH